ncbi:hypothetical protein LTR08_000810 [Meristemomyces frigidus]|nr:hypothetical protein LTR08_000810 [Meristemomyces frigidus]
MSGVQQQRHCERQDSTRTPPDARPTSREPWAAKGRIPGPLSLAPATLASPGNQPAYVHNGFAPPYGPYDSTAISPTPSDPAVGSSEQPATAAGGQKRKEAPNPASSKPVKKVKRVGPRVDSKAGPMSPDGDGEGATSKPKRVRTGCLTCRERHLKCDEALPCCNNCKKSSRTCKRGVRLNFIDTWVDRPPTMATLYGTREWKVAFVDESREIASEYQGGAKLYRLLDQEVAQPEHQSAVYDFAGASVPAAPSMGHQALPPMHSMLPEAYPDPGLQQQQQLQPPPYPDPGVPHQQQPPNTGNVYDPQMQTKPDAGLYQIPPPPSSSTTSAHFDSSIANSTAGHASTASYSTAQTTFPPPNPDPDARKEYLDSQSETLCMQVFVEEVGLWMDSMDPLKHFSRLLPFHALNEPMLLNAFLACGARHLTLVNPSSYPEASALHYYDTATQFLLRNLQNPRRDTVICATTAVILNVYEIMSERALQRMNHIAGARALIKECGWDARAGGIGGACFWLNVGLEVLSCLHFNWQVAWDPDEWGVDVDNFAREERNGREEVWTQRVLWLVAKVCNFRATAGSSRGSSASSSADDEQLRARRRLAEWTHLHALVQAWNAGVPRTMQPVAYLQPWQTSSKSLFPEVWLVKRTTVVARLLWHTAALLLGQVRPVVGGGRGGQGGQGGEGVDGGGEAQRREARMICGIVAHVKDRGVASVALRSLAHAAEVLTDRAEQEEVLAIFAKINKETGWRIGFVYVELRRKWGWGEEVPAGELAQTHTAVREARERGQSLQQQGYQQEGYQVQAQDVHVQPPSSSSSAAVVVQQAVSAPVPAPVSVAVPAPSRGGGKATVNPMYAKADFSLPQHPYQNFYVAPMQGAPGGGGYDGGGQLDGEQGVGQLHLGVGGGGFTLIFDF